uniref:N-acetyltransferase domain-containing protein n=1 Tax=Cyanothece sp. (strain PCC 7425 / ATCC 29141) TaxID=395961 RepID=B8HVG8_CYAP4
MNFQPSDFKEIDRYWADRLNCSPRLFQQTGNFILANESLSGGILITTHTFNCTIVQTPPELLSAIEEQLNVAPLLSPDRVMTALVKMERVRLGWRDLIYYFPPDLPLPPQNLAVRALTSQDEAAVAELLSLVSAEERFLGLLQFEQECTVGLFQEEVLLAIAFLVLKNAALAEVTMITHPYYRKSELGRDVMIAVIRRGLERRWLIQYTLRAQDQQSRQVAESLGFWLYATQQFFYLI